MTEPHHEKSLLLFFCHNAKTVKILSASEAKYSNKACL